METHIIVALSLTLLFLLFVMWKDRQVHNKLETLETQMSELKGLVSDEKGLDQAGSQELETQISQLQNSVNALLQDNQKDALKDVFAEIVLQEIQEINVLSDIARQADELQVEIVRLEGRRLIAFSDSPPEISAHNPYWRDLSFWMRAKKQWTCENEECRINLEDRPSDLHVHHIRGRGYNSPQHLKVLCRACHAEEPGHAFMKADPEYKAFLKWIEETQHEQTRNNR